MKDSNRKSNVLIAEWEGYESYELNGYTMIEFADDKHSYRCRLVLPHIMGLAHASSEEDKTNGC